MFARCLHKGEAEPNIWHRNSQKKTSDKKRFFMHQEFILQNKGRNKHIWDKNRRNSLRVSREMFSKAQKFDEFCDFGESISLPLIMLAHVVAIN
jgi:hypothetical protein